MPAEEWQHHLLFGLGLSGPNLRFCPGPIQNAVGFFMCGLPGGIDYAMLTAVKEGVMTSAAEKLWNAKIQVWMRAPGVLLSSYAIYLLSRYSPVKGPGTLLPLVSFLLAAFNGAVDSDDEVDERDFEDDAWEDGYGPVHASAWREDGFAAMVGGDE